MNKIMTKNGLILASFAFIVTAIVALTHELTKSAVADQEQRYLLTQLDQVIAPSTYDNDLVKQCVLVTAPKSLGRSTPQRAFIATQNNVPVAIAIEATAPNGYNGNIDLIVSVNPQGKVGGVRVFRHQETPGLGDKVEIAKSTWIESFKDKILTATNESQWRVKKDGGDFDQFTGATITPRAVVQATKKAVNYVTNNYQEIMSNTNHCGAQ